MNRQGVTYETVNRDRDGQRIDNFLRQCLDNPPRSLIYRLLRTGQVRVNGGRVKPRHRLAEGDRVRVPPVSSSGSQPARINPAVLEQVREAILYTDPHQIVIDKPAGMAAHRGSGLHFGLVDVLARLYPDHPGLALVHRLDRGTSGCLLVGLDREALVQQQAALRSGGIEKGYLVLLSGEWREQKQEVDAPLSKGPKGRVTVSASGKPALTRFHRRQRYRGFTLAEAEPVTGRTHQIRAHAAHLGFAVAGDPEYLPRARLQSQRDQGLARMFLHAHRLRLNWPQDIMVNAPLPDSLREFLAQLAPLGK